MVGKEDGLAGRHHFGECGKAGGPGRGLDPSAPRRRADLDPAHFERYRVPRRRRPAVALPGIGIGVEPVVDVNGSQALRRPPVEHPGRRVEKDGGVDAAAVRDPPRFGFGGRNRGPATGGPDARGGHRRPHRLEDAACVRRRRHGPSGARSGAQ